MQNEPCAFVFFLCITAHKEATEPQLLCQVLHRQTKPEKQGTICMPFALPLVRSAEVQHPLLENISTQKQSVCLIK